MILTVTALPDMGIFCIYTGSIHNLIRSHEVRGSIPLSSTKKYKGLWKISINLICFQTCLPRIYPGFFYNDISSERRNSSIPVTGKAVFLLPVVARFPQPPPYRRYIDCHDLRRILAKSADLFPKKVQSLFAAPSTPEAARTTARKTGTSPAKVKNVRAILDHAPPVVLLIHREVVGKTSPFR
jgi:hypothetical protein